MIVGDFFPDDNLDIAWRQHDVYRQALKILVTQTNRFARMARSVLQDDDYAQWGQVVRFDHRTLQSAHDLLAAVWRWAHINPKLGADEPTSHTIEGAWLMWLTDEVGSWIDEPEFIRLFQIILSNQNEDIGYAAEAELCIRVMDKFDYVAWSRDQYFAFMKDRQRYPEGILDRPVGYSSKPLDPYNCYSVKASNRGPK